MISLLTMKGSYSRDRAGSRSYRRESHHWRHQSNRKGVNLPGTVLNLSPMTQKTEPILHSAWNSASIGLPYLSFKSPEMLSRPAGLLRTAPASWRRLKNPPPWITSMTSSDFPMRSWSPAATSAWKSHMKMFPGVRRSLIRSCRLAVKPVIVATQMLDSMVAAPTPTRAEASDVATAIYDGADAVMLSAESAAGHYPREAVEMMSRIIESTERHKLYRSILDASQPGEEQTAPHAIAAAAADLAEALQASAIVAFTSSGATAARIARQRPKVAILAITPDQRVSRQLCLLWGAHSVLSEHIHTYEEMVNRATETALAEAIARPADLIVVVAGIPLGVAGTTNNLRVVQMGRAA